MRVKVSDLAIGEVFYVDFEEEVTIPSNFMLSDEKSLLKVQAKLTKFTDFVMLEATVSTNINGNCDRCLKPTGTGLNFSVFEKFIEEENDEDEVWLYNGRVVELNEPLAVNTFLHIPMSLICNDNCLGLCHKCGTDLNTGECKCDETGDNQFSDILRGFFPE